MKPSKIEFKNPRVYCFTHFALSGIQCGIQSLHATVELCGAHGFGSKRSKNIEEWASHHKTVIVLNGGNSAMLKNLKEMLVDIEDGDGPVGLLDFATFEEDDSTMGGIMTAIAVLVPEEIWGAETYDEDIPWSWYCRDFYNFMKGCRLAG